MQHSTHDIETPPPLRKYVGIPPDLEELVSTLRETEANLEREAEKLTEVYRDTSDFYSEEEQLERTQALAKDEEANAVKLIAEMKQLRDRLKLEADTIENHFQLQYQSFLRIDFVKIMLIANMRAAVKEFFLKSNKALGAVQDLTKRKAISEALLVASKIFSKFALFTYTDEEGLNFSFVKTDVVDLGDAVDSFNKPVAEFPTAKEALKKPLRKEADKHFQVALDCVEKAITRFEAENPGQHKDKFVFSKKAEKSTLNATQKMLDEEKALLKLQDRGAEMVEKFKPHDQSKRRWTPDEKHFSQERELAKSLCERSRILKGHMQEAQAQLLKESTDEHHILAMEVDTHCQAMTETSHELEEATVALYRNRRHQDFATRQNSYQHFQALSESVAQIKVGRRRQDARRRLDLLDIQFGGRKPCKKTVRDREEHERTFDRCEREYRAAIAREARFRQECAGDLAYLEQEKWLRELVNLLMVVIFQNLEFWNKQLYLGASHYKLNDVKVPNGISAAGGILTADLTDLQKIQGVKAAFKVRKEAGPKKFGLFTVRKNSTSEMYDVADIIKDPQKITSETVREVKKAVARIQGNGVKLDLTSDFSPSTKISTVHQDIRLAY